MPTQKPPKIPLPKSWPSHVKSGVLHIISLAHFSITHARGWAAKSVSASVRIAAEKALEDPLARTISDPDSEDEERFITLGQDALGRLIVVVYTWRARSRLRVISARKANRGERGEYEEKK